MCSSDESSAFTRWELPVQCIYAAWEISYRGLCTLYDAGAVNLVGYYPIGCWVVDFHVHVHVEYLEFTASGEDRLKNSPRFEIH